MDKYNKLSSWSFKMDTILNDPDHHLLHLSIAYPTYFFL